MNRLFTIENFVRVPDGTLVAPFLNSKDSNSGLPADLLGDISIAAGIIESGVRSKIHVMPLVTQITFVMQGTLEVYMKDSQIDEPYSKQLNAQQAVITQPGTFFQLINRSETACRVLYIVNPAYMFLLGTDGKLLYDDSIVLDEDWSGLIAAAWQPDALKNAKHDPDYRAQIARQLSSSD